MRRVRRSLVFTIPFAQEDTTVEGQRFDKTHTGQKGNRNSVHSQTALTGPTPVPEVTEGPRSSTVSLCQPRNRRTSVQYQERRSLLADSRPTSAQSPVHVVIRQRFRSIVSSTCKDPRVTCRYVFNRKPRVGAQGLTTAKQPLYPLQGISSVKGQFRRSVPQRC